MIHPLSFPVLLTYGTLTGALLALWLSPRANRLLKPSAWNVTFLLATAFGLMFRCLTPIALIPILIFGAACYGVEQTRFPRIVRIGAALAVVGLSIAFMLHVMPGFNSTKVIDAVRLSRDSPPYTKYLNFDKGLIGLFMLAFGHRLLANRNEWAQMGKIAGAFIPAIFPVVFLLAFALGYVRFDVKCPPFLGVWMWTNLFFTCVAEEALCRGFMQRHLERLFRRFAYGQHAALSLTAALFGIMHFAGGFRYVILAAVSGLGYGLVYQHTKRIEAGILTHFLLNLTHILFFTYPALASAVR